MMAMERMDPIYCINRACKRALDAGTPECPFCNTFQGEMGPLPPLPEPSYRSGAWLDGTSGAAIIWGWLLLGGCLAFCLTALPFWRMLLMNDIVEWLKADPFLAVACLALLWPGAAFIGCVGLLWVLGRLDRSQPESPLLPLIAVLGVIAFAGLLVVPFLRVEAITYMLIAVGLGLRFGAPILDRG